MSDEFDLEGNEDVTDQEAEDQTASSADTEDDAESTSDDVDERLANMEKRVSDLMSKWQKAEQRATEAEQKLTSNESGDSAGMEQYLQLMRDQARDSVYKTDPRFDEYGLDPSLIEGNTPEEMRQSAKRLGSLLDKVAESAEQAALKKHGISPELKRGSSPKLPDVGKMSDEEFEKLIEKAKSGAI